MRGNRDIGGSTTPMRSQKEVDQRTTATKESRPSSADRTRGAPAASMQSRARSSSPNRGSSRAKYASRSADAAEMRRFHHSATRIAHRRQPGEQGLARSVKRGGHEHAACGATRDMLKMPENCQQHPVPRKEERRPDCYRGGYQAGVESTRLCNLNSGDLAKVKHTSRPVYFPATYTDPITHKEFDDEEGLRDQNMLMGAAGVRTDRLTYLNSCQLTTHPTLQKDPRKHMRTDPISHIGGYYEEPGPKKGIKVNPNRGVSNIPTKHTAAPAPPCDADKALWLKKNREVHAGGQVLYNVAGHEDILPPATQDYIKCDWPASEELRNFLDKKWLPSCFRPPGATTKQGNRGLMGSEDMYHALHGDVDGRRRHAMDREAFNQPRYEEEPNYGRDWPLLQIERGAWSALDGHPHVQDAPLRWPANVKAGDYGGVMSERSPNFRTPNGATDFAGLSGLDMWHAVPGSARPATPSKPSEKTLRAAPSTARPASTPAAGGFRGPQPQPGREQARFANPPVDRGSDRTRGSREACQPVNVQMDVTREKGANFSRAEGDGFAVSRGSPRAFTGGREQASPYAASPMVEAW